MITEEMKDYWLRTGLQLRRLSGKKPAFKGNFSKGDTLAEIKEWTGNLGVLTGKQSGIVCLDIDMHGDIDGMENIKSYMAENDLKLPESRLISSPTGGRHIYYKLPVKYYEDRFHPNLDVIQGLDFRNHNQFMVLEGSETENGRYKVLVDIPFHLLPDCPQWLIDLYIKPKVDTDYQGELTFIGNKMTEWAQGMSEGNRNLWLTRQVGFMFRQGLDLNNVFTWASVINVNFIKPPLEHEEIVAMINSVYRSEQHKQNRK